MHYLKLALWIGAGVAIGVAAAAYVAKKNQPTTTA